jgi:hypothetical protein
VLTGIVDLRAGIAEHAARFAIPDVHADSFENRQRRRGSIRLIGGNHFGVVQPHAGLLPRTLQGSVLRGLVSRPRLRLPGSIVTGRQPSQAHHS